MQNGRISDLQHDPIDVQLHVVVMVQELEHAHAPLIHVVLHGKRTPIGVECRVGTLAAGVLVQHLPRLS